MDTYSKSDWLVPAGLVALSIIPVTAGAFRLFQLSSGALIAPDNARFFASPWPVVLHIVAVTIYCILGAFQFSHGFRQRQPLWHHYAGRLLIVFGLVAALSGVWMTMFYARVEFDGAILYVMRLLVGCAMVLFLCLGYGAIRRGDILRHQSWMMRSYALGLGAGTQVLTHLPWLLFPSIQGELARTLSMGIGWTINVALVEWWILRERHKKSC